MRYWRSVIVSIDRVLWRPSVQPKRQRLRRRCEWRTRFID